eukprot:COSAG05_NODE_13279_length_435_cov_1.142857_1_plen_36_part_01
MEGSCESIHSRDDSTQVKQSIENVVTYQFGHVISPA